ncbi:thymidylate synthase [Sphingomonas sp. 3-13AW]|uniref:thymidylate synthase n=1 Tax=Sphingomonas sp. 3-13AW TaxID=3050450 RepID=UPI003BB69911
MSANPQEQAYLDLLTEVVQTGYEQTDRTGVGTRQRFRRTLRFDLSDGSVPIFTTKFVSWKTAFREMLWFLSGSPSIEPLLRQKVRIWTEWPHAKYVKATGDNIDLREFEQRILNDPEFSARWADSGRAYGVQWRSWRQYQPAPDAGDGLWREVPGGIDQVRSVLDTIRNNPSSRRIILEGWNVSELDDMMLPPCHKTYQFEVEGDRLSLAVGLRSWDLWLGGPFNCAQAAMLLRLVAMHTGLKPGELVMDAVCAHVYLNHLDQVALQTSRTPTAFPKLDIKPRDDFFAHEIDDFVVTGYEHQGEIKGAVAV